MRLPTICPLAGSPGTSNLRGNRGPLTRRLLDAITDLCLRHSRAILVSAAILAALSLAAASTIRFDPDLLNLIPQHNREVNDFKRVLQEMGTIDYHIVVIDLPAEADVADYEELITGIAGSYEASPLIREVLWEIPNPVDLIDEVLPSAMLFLTPGELALVGERLTDEGIRESVARNRQLLQTPQGSALKDVVRYDPFNLLPVFLEKFQAAGSGFQVDATSGFYLSEDRSMVLILARPVRPAQDVPFSLSIMETAEQIESDALESFRRSHPELPLPDLEYTGGYAIALSDAELIKKDVIGNVLFSVIGVLSIFLYGFRRLASVGYAALPMLLALALTFGFAGIFYGELSSLSAGFAALLAGLGVDFIMVFYGRYVDERNRGSSMPEALRHTIHSILPAVGIAATTTAGTFFGFLATDFAGMTQLGFLTGVGILLFFVSVVLVLPALLVQAEKKEGGRSARLYHHGFGSSGVMLAAMRRPRTVIGIWIAVCVISVILATQITFSDNLQNLRAKGNRGIVTQERITERFGQSFDFMMYVIEAPTLEETLTRTTATLPDLERLRREGTIASYQSIATFIPPESQQREVIRQLSEDESGRFEADRIESTFRAALVENGFVADAWDEYLPLFREALSPDAPISLEDEQSEHLSGLTSRFLHQTGRGWMSVVYLYPATGVWPRDVPEPLLTLEETHPGTVLTGVNRVSQVLRGIVRQDAIRATSLGLFLVVTLMFIGFRRIGPVLLAFLPFLAGVTGMLGAMSLLGLEFNFMNVFVGVMIIGVATDYSIYMIKRFQEDPSRFAVNAAETGKAVVMAAITSIVGYGSFALSSYPGLRSIGYASLFGIGLSGLAAVTLLPAVLILLAPQQQSGDDAESTTSAV